MINVNIENKNLQNNQCKKAVFLQKNYKKKT